MNNQPKQGWTHELPSIDDDLEPLADTVGFNLEVAKRVHGLEQSPESQLGKTKEIMRRKIDEINDSIKQAKASADVQIERIEDETKSKNDQDQSRIDDLRAQIAEITASTKDRSADAKARIKSINEGRDYQIADLEQYRLSCEAFLAASARKAN